MGAIASIVSSGTFKAIALLLALALLVLLLVLTFKRKKKLRKGANAHRTKNNARFTLYSDEDEEDYLREDKTRNSGEYARNTGNGYSADDYADASDEKDDSSGASSRKGRLERLRTTQSVCPIIDIRDGVMVSKDARFYKLLEFAPTNFELRSPSEQEAIIERFAAAIRTSPRVVHLKIVSTKSDVAPFISDLEGCRQRELENGNDGCAELIEDQIRKIEDISGTQGVSRRFFVIIEYEAESGLRRRPPFKNIADALNREARSMAASMEACGNMLVSRDDRDYIQSAIYVMNCKLQSYAISYEERREAIMSRYTEANGGSVSQKNIPAADFFSPDSITSVSPKYLIIDGAYVSYWYLPGNAYPLQAYGGWLQVLFGYMDGVDVDFWIDRVADVEKLGRKLSLHLKSNKIKENSSDDIARDYENTLAAVSSGYYLKQALADGDEVVYMSAIITITGASLEDMQARESEMKDHLLRNDMRMKRCTFQQEEAYRACMPLTDYSESIFAKSKRNITVSQLASCYPFTAYELMDEGGVFLGVNARYGSPVFVNMFDTSKYQSANTIILGPSGSGKTYTLMSMLLRMRQIGLQVFIVAPLKGFEFKRACEAINGEYIRIAPGSSQNINVMEIRKADRGHSRFLDGQTDRGSILADKIQQMLTFFSVLLPDITELEKQLLDEALKQTYLKAGITDDNDSLTDESTGSYKPMPTLRDLHSELALMGADTKRMHSALSRYVTGSARSFSLPTNVNLTNRFVVIDVSDLTAEMLPVGMFIALDMLLDYAKQDITRRKVIAIDEMWRLMRASRQSAEFVRRIYKEIRGYAGAAVGATQDLADILQDETGSAVINNARFKILMPMDKKEADALAQVTDLTGEEIAQLKRTALTGGNGGKRKALLIANNDHTFVTIDASEREHELITTNAADLKRIAERKERLARETL